MTANPLPAFRAPRWTADHEVVENPKSPTAIADSVEDLLAGLKRALESDGVDWGYTDAVIESARPFVYAAVAVTVNEIVDEWHRILAMSIHHPKESTDD